eukprot:6205136-Pleurochrysis_carterae.AAC.2
MRDGVVFLARSTQDRVRSERRDQSQFFGRFSENCIAVLRVVWSNGGIFGMFAAPPAHALARRNSCAHVAAAPAPKVSVARSVHAQSHLVPAAGPAWVSAQRIQRGRGRFFSNIYVALYSCQSLRWTDDSLGSCQPLSGVALYSRLTDLAHCFVRPSPRVGEYEDLLKHSAHLYAGRLLATSYEDLRTLESKYAQVDASISELRDAGGMRQLADSISERTTERR